MGSESVKIPTIDFSLRAGLKPGSPEWDSTKDQVQKALEEFGCFEALYDKIPPEFRKAMFDTAQDLFNLPLETKSRNSSDKPHHGYAGQYPSMPLYESLEIEDAIPEKIEKFANQMWPEGNTKLCKTVQSYVEQMSEFDKMVRRMMLESFGLEKYTDEHMESTHPLFRFIQYKAPQTSETKLGAHAHTHKNLITILCQNQVQGLEILTKDGHWIQFKPSPTSLIVMVADCLHAWTNGRLHAPHHRVMVSGNEARYTLAFFVMPKAGYIIKAPEELVDEEHPLQFKPFDQAEFYSFYNTEAGQRAELPLKTYCGV